MLAAVRSMAGHAVVGSRRMDVVPSGGMRGGNICPHGSAIGGLTVGQRIVTLQTDVDRLGSEQLRMIGAMAAMAGEAVRRRFVTVAASQGCCYFTVAAGTQHLRLGQQQRCLAGGMRVVTGQTLAFTGRCMQRAGDRDLRRIVAVKAQSSASRWNRGNVVVADLT